MISTIEIIIRIFLATILGGLIGIEREVNNRPAGLRTHVLVTLGSTLIMLISVDAFKAIGDGTLADPSRIAAQVVSGMGFLGAGTILRTGNNVTGLTTAASLWVSAGIGLGIGVGYYFATILTAAIVLLTLLSLRTLEKKVLKSKYKSVVILSSNRPGIIGQIGVTFGEHNISIKDISITDDDNKDDEDGTMETEFTIKVPNFYDTYNLYRELYDISGVITVTYQGDRIKHGDDGNTDII